VKVERIHKNLIKQQACERCGYLNNLERHHVKARAEGGKDDPSNLKWLCRACHDYQHAKEAVLKAINAEKRRLAVLEKRLALIERENTPEKIRQRGYQSYFDFYKEPLPDKTMCGRY